MNPTIVVLFVAVLGALARTLVPYLETLRDNPETPFDRKFLVPPVVSCVIALITLPLALSALPKELMESATLSTSGLVAVFLAVWGATDVVRSGQIELPGNDRAAIAELGPRGQQAIPRHSLRAGRPGRVV